MVPATRVGEFYLAYHRYLKDNGIDGVKVRAIITTVSAGASPSASTSSVFFMFMQVGRKHVHLGPLVV